MSGKGSRIRPENRCKREAEHERIFGKRDLPGRRRNALFTLNARERAFTRQFRPPLAR